METNSQARQCEDDFVRNLPTTTKSQIHPMCSLGFATNYGSFEFKGIYVPTCES